LAHAGGASSKGECCTDGSRTAASLWPFSIFACCCSHRQPSLTFQVFPRNITIAAGEPTKIGWWDVLDFIGEEAGSAPLSYWAQPGARKNSPAHALHDRTRCIWGQGQPCQHERRGAAGGVDAAHPGTPPALPEIQQTCAHHRGRVSGMWYMSSRCMLLPPRARLTKLSLCRSHGRPAPALGQTVPVSTKVR